jgi:hypothetical protein
MVILLKIREDERRPPDYYITCIFRGSGVCDNARHRASLNRCAPPITTWRKSEEATVLYDIESDAVMPGSGGYCVLIRRSAFGAKHWPSIRRWFWCVPTWPPGCSAPGRAEQARAVVRKALEFNPSFQATRDFLG